MTDYITIIQGLIVSIFYALGGYLKNKAEDNSTVFEPGNFARTLIVGTLYASLLTLVNVPGVDYEQVAIFLYPVVEKWLKFLWNLLSPPPPPITPPITPST